MVMKIGLNIIQ